MKSILSVVAALVLFAQPVSGQALAKRWEVRFDAAPRDILAGDTVAVADGASQGVLELEVQGDSVVAHWDSDQPSGPQGRELRGTWRNGTLRLMSTEAFTVHPTVNGVEMSVDLYTTWDGRLIGSQLRGTISIGSKDGMVQSGTRAFEATGVTGTNQPVDRRRGPTPPARR